MEQTKTAQKSSLIEFEMTVVIPVAQYANAQPVIKGYGKTWEEARDDALEKAADLWAMIGEGGHKLEIRKKTAIDLSGREKLTCFVSGLELYYDDASHTYLDENGDEYLSGSKFAHQFSPVFDKSKILPKYASSNGVAEQQIDGYWRAKNMCSTTFGTAIHQAMETYGTHKSLSDKLSKDIGVHPIVLPIVEKFFEVHEGERLFEKFVADQESKRCGRIDSILVTGEKKCVIEDFKTNIDLYKQNSPKKLLAPYDELPNQPIGEYTLQLNFYRSIMEAGDWEVEKMLIHHLTPGGEWVEVEVPKIELKEK